MLQRSKSPPAAVSGFGSAEDRQEERRRVLLQGRLLIGRAVVYCAVRDLSPGGARLEIGADVELPPEFGLVIGPNERILRARLRWRAGGFAGVSLDAP